MKIDRLSWTGFGIVLIGWAVLLADLAVSDAMLKNGNAVAVLSWRADVLTLAQTAIASGFGLAVVGTLRSGFGAFTRFFDAVLQRSVPPRPKEPTPLEPEPIAVEPIVVEPMTVEPVAVEPDRTYATETAMPRAPTLNMGSPISVEPAARPRPERRPSRERNFVILSDGSVEVETMFGTRVFANMDEAKDFIR